MNIAETMQSLYANYGELEGITIECQNELLAIGIQNTAAKAEIFLQGAQISQYQRHNEEPVLWLSKACVYQNGSPLRGGIPICWPWFGDINKNPQAVQSPFTEDKLKTLSAHGFIRERNWEVNAIQTPTDNITIIELRYQIFAEQEPLWPFATDLIYRIEIGEQLKASLTIKNLDSMPFNYSCALHSYFAIDHINHARIKGFDQSDYIDTLADWSQYIQKGDILFNNEVDRIYQSAPEAIQLIDNNREIHIKSTGSNSTVIWNPWVDKAKRLSQFNAEDYQKMLCIETANIMDDVVYLEPSEAHSLTVIIS